jgi:hypothetical protein
VLRWHWTRINNGVLEGINSLVRAAKRRARGYRNKRNLIAMIYLIAGRLDSHPPTPTSEEPFVNVLSTQLRGARKISSGKTVKAAGRETSPL